ncbi:MAG TPA: hypothetical protein VFL64_14255 [Rhizobacter sp.]|nr:hypothetical protein [Rhizobacter sp.]
MALLIVGALLVALGLFAGGVLVASPLGWAPAAVDPTLWLLFPLLSIAGFALFVIGAKTAHIRGLSMAVSCALLALAVIAAGGLVSRAAGFVHSEAGSLSLWYVLVVAGLLGAIGAASRSRSVDPA